MSKIYLKTRERSILADTITPVSIYLKLRDRFANSFLLESSDNHGEENSFSYICCSPIAFIRCDANRVEKKLPGQNVEVQELESLQKEMESFFESFDSEKPNGFIRTGLFGYFNYEAKTHFRKANPEPLDVSIPLAQYHLFQFVVAFDHLKNECHIVETFVDEPEDGLFEEVIGLMQQRNLPGYPFRTTGDIESNRSDESFKQMVQRGIDHCHAGDVFQVVFSMNFEVPFQGDDFQVYRTLRSVNPSPYLFYFDYGGFRLFGSSPEAQVVLSDGYAEIHPIAGTFRRTGNDEEDAVLAAQLQQDSKEDSEHVMLVDLARNDLSRSCDHVEVASYKEVQYYSHVLHLVSRVRGALQATSRMMDVVAETFPAGTLSGAPKIRAMEIIQENEKHPRGFYGGAIGFLDFHGNFNHAIMIRSFMAKDNVLTFQAGAGIVAQSQPEKELEEVYNKVGALKQAITAAEQV